MNTDLKRVQARIRGRVQGVGFRYFTRSIAVELGCTGWVRNRIDGSVEMLAEGKKTNLEALIQAVRKGPRSGYVKSLDEDWSDGSGEFDDFHVRMTC